MHSHVLFHTAIRKGLLMLVGVATVPSPNLGEKELRDRSGFPPNPSQAKQQARKKVAKELKNTMHDEMVVL